MSVYELRGCVCVCLLTSENSSPTMSDLHNWIHPVKELDDSPKTIPKLVNLIKE